MEKGVLINVDSEFDFANIAAAARKVRVQLPFECCPLHPAVCLVSAA